MKAKYQVLLNLERQSRLQIRREKSWNICFTFCHPMHHHIMVVEMPWKASLKYMIEMYVNKYHTTSVPWPHYSCTQIKINYILELSLI
jgi:hypothetical protein